MKDVYKRQVLNGWKVAYVIEDWGNMREFELMNTGYRRAYKKKRIQNLEQIANAHVG